MKRAYLLLLKAELVNFLNLTLLRAPSIILLSIVFYCSNTLFDFVMSLSCLFISAILAFKVLIISLLFYSSTIASIEATVLHKANL